VFCNRDAVCFVIERQRVLYRDVVCFVKETQCVL
jgi:hypothetical protein